MKKIFIRLFVFTAIFVFLSLQNRLLTVSNYVYYSDKISEDIRIVQISDLHNANFGNNQKVLIKKIKDLEPDVIVFTGDMIDSRRTQTEKDLLPCIDLVSGLQEYPMYYITGNHEGDNQFWNVLQKELENLGVVFLDSQTVDYKDIGISGIYDQNFYRKVSFKTRLKDLNENIDKEKLNILLSHRPDYFNEYKESDFDLIFSGHAHGGQWRIPFILPHGLFAPGQEFFPKYTDGINNFGNYSLVISRGLGNSGCPLRLFNYPEIVVVDILKQ